MKQFFATCILSVCGALVCCQDNQEVFYDEHQEPLVLLPLPLIRVRRDDANSNDCSGSNAKLLPHCTAAILGRMNQNRPATTKFNLHSPGIGTVEHSGTIFNNERHQLDASAYAQKDFSKNVNILQPDRAGGQVDYHSKPSQSTFSIGADHTKGFGTDVSAAGQYNIIQQKNFELGVGGEYTRHYGGPGGTGHPDAGVYVKGKGTF